MATVNTHILPKEKNARKIGQPLSAILHRYFVQTDVPRTI